VSVSRAVPHSTQATLAPLLAGRQPVSVEQTVWPGGLSLEFALYLGPAEYGQAIGGPECWVDTEGHVLRSWLTDFGDAATLPLTEAEQHAIRVVRGRT
jgi:hypothetical protein